MKYQTFHTVRYVLLLMVLVAAVGACGGGASSGPEEAASEGFETWARAANIAYRNDRYETMKESDAFATIRLTADFQNSSSSPWIEQEATIEVIRQRDEWVPPVFFAFAPTRRAQQTAQAVTNATASIGAEVMQATAAARAAAQDATATVEAVAAQETVVTKNATATADTIASQATRTAEAEIAAVTATAQEESRHATAMAQSEARAATATAQVAVEATAASRARERFAAAGAEFDGNALPEGWEVIRPDPSQWSVADGSLLYQALPGIDDWIYNNEIIRPLPSIDGDLDIIIKLRVEGISVNSASYAFDFRVGSDRCPQSFYIAVGLNDDGPFVSSAHVDDCYRDDRRAINFQLDQDVYLKMTRRQDGAFAAYVSHDGQSWTYVNELGGLPAFDHFGIFGLADPSDESLLIVDWVHFESPE